MLSNEHIHVTKHTSLSQHVFLSRPTLVFIKTYSCFYQDLLVFLSRPTPLLMKTYYCVYQLSFPTVRSAGRTLYTIIYQYVHGFAGGSTTWPIFQNGFDLKHPNLSRFWPCHVAKCRPNTRCKPCISWQNHVCPKANRTVTWLRWPSSSQPYFSFFARADVIPTVLQLLFHAPLNSV